MRVLLRKDVDGIGRRGDVVEVTGGFARNFLLPSGAAMRATDEMQQQAASMRRARDLRDAKDRDAAEQQRQAIESARITVAARASAQGKLFGSIGPLEIATAIERASGVVIDRGQVQLDEHLKEVGTYEVPIRLFGGVAATASVEVAPQD